MTLISAPDRESAQDRLARLLERVEREDREAFAELYRETSAKLFGVVCRVLGRGPRAEDVLQEIYVRVWDRAGEFDSARGSAIAWLCAIARNRAIDEARRRSDLRAFDDAEEPELPAELDDPLAPRERRERLAALLACLEALDGERREAVLLAYCRGASREELARRYGRPAATIKTLLRRSLLQLRTCLSQ